MAGASLFTFEYIMCITVYLRCTQTTIHPGAAKKDPNHEPLITLNK